jgi:hypothetical protein
MGECMKKILLLAILFMIGCGSASPPQAPPKTVQVNGKISSSGGSITSGRIVFKPKVGGNQEAYGTIGNDGTYKLSSFNKDDGAMAGEYIVYIENSKNAPRKYQSEKTSDLIVSVEEGKTDYPIYLK